MRHRGFAVRGRPPCAGRRGLPEGRNPKDDVECYDSARFFPVTGDHVPEIPTAVARRQEALVAIHREYVQENDTPFVAVTANSGAECGFAVSSSILEIDRYGEQLVEKAMAASSGEKFERLWNGNILGYDSQSEADMALCCLLAFWTGGYYSQMNRLFRQSSLIREKWDEVHYVDGSTYGEKTIERAVATTSEFLDPEPVLRVTTTMVPKVMGVPLYVVRSVRVTRIARKRTGC